MNTRELIEAAQLDALGLLDGSEIEAFERALAAAPEPVRDQIRLEQSRLSRIDGVLPRVSPPADLRARVLARVREAIAQAIGSRGLPRLIPEFMPSRRVSSAWRAASLGLAAAAVVCAAATVYMAGQFNDVEKRIQSNIWIDTTAQLVGEERVRQVLVDPRTRCAQFEAVDPEVKAMASLWSNPSWDRPLLWHLNLTAAPGKVCRLAVLDESGEVTAIVATFDSGAGLESRPIVLDVRSNLRLAIVETDADYQVGGKFRVLLEARTA